MYEEVKIEIDKQTPPEIGGKTLTSILGYTHREKKHIMCSIRRVRGGSDTCRDTSKNCQKLHHIKAIRETSKASKRQPLIRFTLPSQDPIGDQQL